MGAFDPAEQRVAQLIVNLRILMNRDEELILNERRRSKRNSPPAFYFDVDEMLRGVDHLQIGVLNRRLDRSDSGRPGPDRSNALRGENSRAEEKSSRLTCALTRNRLSSRKLFQFRTVKSSGSS